VRRTDRRLWRLSRAATEEGLTDVFREHTGARLLAAVRSDPRATAWFASFEQFVDRFGTRSDQVADVGTPSWLEAPERPLQLVRQMVLDGGDPTRAAEAQSRRQAARLAELRARMSPRNRGAFERSYAWCQRGNFTWWNEEHNTHIDLRAHLPVRAIGRAVAAASGGRPDDGVLLYAGEVRALCDGELGWADVSGLVVERAEHLAAWRQRRGALPGAVGTVSGQVDPLMAEIIGVEPGAPAPSGPELLQGIPASAGIARGPVRRLSDAGQLDLLAPGDVLVCEATSPSWTPVFPRLSACLCDSGGVLTHAAIACREYGVPCVLGLGVAMQTLQDGDLVEVDGRAGTVTVLRRA
jgi:pyruvate,water dikinase